jgi:hypothetical protein
LRGESLRRYDRAYPHTGFRASLCCHENAGKQAEAACAHRYGEFQ